MGRIRGFGPVAEKSPRPLQIRYGAQRWEAAQGSCLAPPRSPPMLSVHPISAVRRCLLFPRDHNADTVELVGKIADLVRAHGGICGLPKADAPAYAEALKDGRLEAVQDVDDTPWDLLVALGGDGTLLRASRFVAERKIPVVGINHGDLGFLTAAPREQWKDLLGQALAGELVWEPRLRMRVELWRQGKQILEERASNDCYVKHGAMPRLLQLATYIGDHFSATYTADGLIVCTPMGSTAYNLAAGGPMLEPGLDAFTITPLCPHSLTLRPVVCGAANGVRIRYLGPSEEASAFLTVDGQTSFELQVDDEVRILRSTNPLCLVPPRASVFQVLAAKLGWSDAGVKHPRAFPQVEDTLPESD